MAKYKEYRLGCKIISGIKQASEAVDALWKDRIAVFKVDVVLLPTGEGVYVIYFSEEIIR